MLYLGVSDTHEKQLTILEALTRKFTISDECDLSKVAETLPFTYTGADLYALCSDAMLKAITRQAMHVDREIQELEKQGGGKVTTAWFFDNAATEADISVVVSMRDFDEARRELVGSVRCRTPPPFPTHMW
jgi:peroxin-6